MTASPAVAFTPDPELSFWPTPPDVADDLVMWVLQPWHHLGEGVRVLEPSAGDGHLAAAVRHRLPESHVTAVEPDAARAARLRGRPDVVDQVVESTLEDYLPDVTRAAAAGAWEPFHLVLMNPPFALAGRPEAWAEHFLAIVNHPDLLAPGGVVAAVVPRIVLTGKSRLVRAVRDLLHPAYGAEPCERGAFGSVGAAVSTALIWAEKPCDATEGGLW